MREFTGPGGAAKDRPNATPKTISDQFTLISIKLKLKSLPTHISLT
ncbi:hypothetical protein Mcup_0112 [Metallosphaera cuprina Ar-4]|uniref:Uncharacterized protein n=1 Tax=Metallosphaera cuprina (strain Ar-4) TaxID=1006006 RepID=F4FYA2_METCR|nr:hypothetical protein Mcup_0112 [Metallosphaera cuprina Ar-4]